MHEESQTQLSALRAKQWRRMEIMITVKHCIRQFLITLEESQTQLSAVRAKRWRRTEIMITIKNCEQQF